jgi:hypothetical protein
MKRNPHNTLRALVFASLAALISSASAYDGAVPVTKVVVLESTYLPGYFAFIIDQQVANCPAGEWLIWDGGAAYPPASADAADRKTNVKGMSNTVLAALHTGGRLRVYARNKPTATGSCVAEFIHALPAQ